MNKQKIFNYIYWLFTDKLLHKIACHFNWFPIEQLNIIAIVHNQWISLKHYWFLESISVDLRNKFIYWSFSQMNMKIHSNVFVQYRLEIKSSGGRNGIVVSSAKWTSRLWPHGSFNIMIYRKTLIHLNVKKSMFLLPLFISICLFAAAISQFFFALLFAFLFTLYECNLCTY